MGVWELVSQLAVKEGEVDTAIAFAVRAGTAADLRSTAAQGAARGWRACDKGGGRCQGGLPGRDCELGYAAETWRRTTMRRTPVSSVAWNRCWPLI